MENSRLYFVAGSSILGYVRVRNLIVLEFYHELLLLFVITHLARDNIYSGLSRIKIFWSLQLNYYYYYDYRHITCTITRSHFQVTHSDM